MTTIREVHDAVEIGLHLTGFYAKGTVDGLRYRTIPAALQHAEKRLGLKFSVEDWGHQGCRVVAPGVRGWVEVHACRQLDELGRDGRPLTDPDFGATHTGG